MHRCHQKVFQVAPGQSLCLKRSKPRNTKWKNGRTGVRAGGFTFNIPSHANCRCSCRPLCRTGHGHCWATTYCHSSCHNVLMANVTSQQHAKAVYEIQSKAQLCSGLISVALKLGSAGAGSRLPVSQHFWKSCLLAFGHLRRRDTPVNQRNTDNATGK